MRTQPSTRARTREVRDHLGNHQGVEEPALRSRAPTEGRGEPGSAPGGVDGSRGPRKAPSGCESGREARLGANVAGFLGGMSGAPRHGRGGQQLAPLGPTHRPHPLALPPEAHAAAAAPAPTQAAAQVMAGPGSYGPRRQARGGWERISGAGHPPGRSGPPEPLPFARQEDTCRPR